MGQKLARSLCLLQFSRYSHFFIFLLNLRWPPKVAKLFFSFEWNTLILPCRSKFHLKSLYLLRFSRYSHFSFSAKIKVAKIEIFPLGTGYSCTTLQVKSSLKIAQSLLVCETFVIFHIFTESSNKVAITHLYIEQL